eukprot:ANDGO_03535.mRNA.1 Short-chain dehydrogenase TIC 32
MMSFLRVLWFCILGLYLYVVEAIDWWTSPAPYVPASRRGTVSVNRGKWAVVTGGNGGIGLETVRAFLQDGVNVVIGCRSSSAGDAAVKSLEQDASATGSKVVHASLDLSSFSSVLSFAAHIANIREINQSGLHVLVCNAGIMAVPFARTIDGFESQIATNHLGHTLLVRELLPLLRKAGSGKKDDPARVVMVTSSTHYNAGPMDYASWKSEKNYSPGGMYEQSKLANLYVAFAMQKQYAPTVQFYAVHPGIVATGIARGLPLGLPIFVNAVGKVMFKSPAQGAETQVTCALDPKLAFHGGKYYANSKEARASQLALDEKRAAECLDTSLKILTDVVRVPGNKAN